MSEENRKPYLSPTQIDMASKCGELYRLVYLEGRRAAPGVAAVKGKSVHFGGEQNFRQKIETAADLPAEQVIEIAVDHCENQFRAGGIAFTKEEKSIGQPKVLETAVDSVVRMTRLHMAEQAPAYQPVAVEQTLRVVLPKSARDLLVTIDLVDISEAVVDLKTSGKAKAQSEADQSVQLTSYHFARTMHTGKEPPALILDTMIDGKTKLQRQRLQTVRTRRDHVALGHRFAAVSEMIDRGVFMPALPGSWYCSAKWCGFWHECRFVNAERMAAAESRGEE